MFERSRFEDGIAAEHLSEEEVLSILDAPAYFDLLERSFPDGRTATLDALRRGGLVQRSPAGGWDVTNLGAILFAKSLDDFKMLKIKSVRVIQYNVVDRIDTIKERINTRGYASGFRELLEVINNLLPSNELIGRAFRRTAPMFPELAVRELVANAIIHQDFFTTGAGPMVELFDGRIEITNPGEPLVDANRLLDSPPASRNEQLASMMRLFRICEERGSGIDKVISQVEFYQLPPPLFEVPPGFTRIVLFAHRPLTEMDKDERIRACYLHACLKYVQREAVTNTSVRERFGIEEHNRSVASRLLREAIEAGVIALRDPDASPKQRQYVPWWASSAAHRQDSCVMAACADERHRPIRYS
jgi:ATP-dependent DNA helicase RecG